MVVAEDYAEGLRSVLGPDGEPGHDGHTNEDFALGAAMAIPVLRPGGWKTTVVLAGGLARGMLSEDAGVNQRACANFVHELAHMADYREKARMWAPFEADFPVDGLIFFEG